MAEENWLDHDSFVELRQLCSFTWRELRSAQIIGRLSVTGRQRLVAAAQKAATLSADDKDLIAQRLSPQSR